MLSSRVGVLGAVALLTACGTGGPGSAEGRGCTLIGTGNIVGVTVAADVAPVRALDLQLCVGDRCRDQRVQLTAGSSTVDQGCSDGVCAATAFPDGTQFALASMDLVEGPCGCPAAIGATAAR